MAITFTIDGVDRTANVYREPGFGNIAISMPLMATWEARFPVFDLDSTSSAYRPSIGDTVLIEDNGTDIFNGVIVSVSDGPVAGTGSGTRSDIVAKAQYVFTDQAEVTISYAAGFTLRQIVVDLAFNFLTDYGLGAAVDPGMANGPTMPALTFDHVRFSDAMNKLSSLTGWAWRLTPGNIIEVFEIGTETAAFSLTSAARNTVGPIKWSQNRETQYVNSATVMFGQPGVFNTTFTATGDGLTDEWVLELPALVVGTGLISRGLVTEGAVETTVGLTGAGTAYEYDEATQTLTRTAGNLPNLTVITWIYSVQYPQTITVEDSGAIASEGLYARTFKAPDVFAYGEAEGLADGLLRRGLVTPKRAIISTRQGLELPGTTFTVTFANRGLSGAHVIMQTDLVDFGMNGEWEYTYTLLSGDEAQGGWTDRFREQLSGVGTGSGAITVSGSVMPSASGRFSQEVIAHTGRSEEEAILGNLHTEGSYIGGPGVLMNRNPDTGAGRGSWAVLTDQVSGDQGLMFQDRAVTGLGTHTFRVVEVAANDYALHPASGVSFRLGYAALQRITSVDSTTGYFERTRTTALGERIAVAHSAGNFTASAGTWTVDSGDQLEYSYSIHGKTMTVWFVIITSDVSNAGAVLRLAVPGGFTIASGVNQQNLIRVSDAGAAAAVGVAAAISNSTYIELYSTVASAGFASTSSDNTSVIGQITFSVA